MSDGADTEKAIKLRRAANEAREVIKQYREDIVWCECVHGPDGQSMLETMGNDVRREVARLDDLIERLA